MSSSADAKAAPGWEARERPPLLFRRFEFDSYAETRGFLDRLAAFSEETGYYPDISFGTRYANITVHARNGTALAAEDLAFAEGVSRLAGSDEGSP